MLPSMPMGDIDGIIVIDGKEIIGAMRYIGATRQEKLGHRKIKGAVIGDMAC